MWSHAAGKSGTAGLRHADEWMHSWAQQVGELLNYFSREIAKLVERMDAMELKVRASLDEAARQVYRRSGEQIVGVLSEASSQREELSESVAEALGREREKR